MRLRSLKLQNYRRFRDTELEFPDGLMGILGKNGSGKSTIIESIAFALYGNSPIIRTSKDLIPFNGKSVKEPCRVELEFDLDGENFKVIREMRGKNLSMRAEMYQGSILLADGDKGVSQKSAEIFNMDWRSFSTSVFAKQKELAALTDLEPSERKKEIIKLLQIDSIEKAIVLVNNDRRNLSKEIESIASHFDGPQLERTLVLIKDLEKKVTMRKQKLKSTELRLMELEKKRKKTELEWTSWKKKRDKYLQLKKELEISEHDIRGLNLNIRDLELEERSLNKKKGRMDKIHTKVMEYAEIKVQIVQLDENRNAYMDLREKKRELAKLDSDIKAVQVKKKEFTSMLGKKSVLLSSQSTVALSLSNCRKNLERRSLESSVSKKELEMAEKKQMQIKVRVEKIMTMGEKSSCPTCERLLGAHYNFLLNRLKEEATGADAIIDELKNEINEAEKNIKVEENREAVLIEREIVLKMQSTKMDVLESRLQDIEENISSLDIARAAVMNGISNINCSEFDEVKYQELISDRARLEKFSNEYISMSSQYDALPSIMKRIADSKRRVNKAGTAIQTNKKKLKELKFREDSYNRSEKNIRVSLEKIHKLRENVQETRNEIKISMIQLKNGMENKERLEVVKMKVEEHRGNLEDLEKLTELFSVFKNSLVSRIIPALSETMSDLMRELTGGRYSEVMIDSDYNIQIRDGSNYYGLDRFSGGESDLANICLRLAISKLISDQSSGGSLNFLVLDEVFGSQDFERRKAILDTLGAMSKRFSQIILITHIDEIKDFLPNVIMVSENQDMTSGAKLNA